MNKLHLFHAVTLCALLGPVCSLTAVEARTPAESSVAVSYRDLDLSRAADVRVLYHRLRNAAASVCTEVPSYDLPRSAEYRRCFEATLDQAVASVNLPALSALEHGTGSGAERVAQTHR